MMNFTYEYSFNKNERDSYMFALDRLDDIGVLPDGYQSVLDPSNSYTSSTYTNSHRLSPFFIWIKDFDKSRFSIFTMPRFTIEHNHLDYWRENRSYLVKRTSFLFSHSSYNGLLSYDFSKSDDGSNHYGNTLSYKLNLNTSTPELLHLVDVVNDADPLNISVGNPDLRNAFTQKHGLKWFHRPASRSTTRSTCPMNSYPTRSCAAMSTTHPPVHAATAHTTSAATTPSGLATSSISNSVPKNSSPSHRRQISASPTTPI